MKVYKSEKGAKDVGGIIPLLVGETPGRAPQKDLMGPGQSRGVVTPPKKSDDITPPDKVDNTKKFWDFFKK